MNRSKKIALIVGLVLTGTLLFDWGLDYQRVGNLVNTNRRNMK